MRVKLLTWVSLFS